MKTWTLYAHLVFLERLFLVLLSWNDNSCRAAVGKHVQEGYCLVQVLGMLGVKLSQGIVFDTDRSS